MKNCPFYTLSAALVLWGGGSECVLAQEATAAQGIGLSASLSTDHTPVVFKAGADISQYAIPEAPLKWGMDAAWISEDNVRRGTNYIGQNYLQVGRVSFQPSDLIGDNGELSNSQKTYLNKRLAAIEISGVKNLVLNCDHEVLCNAESYPNCAQNYANYYGKPAEWVKVIKATVKYCKSKGFQVVTISPFNEPDYTAWKEGTQAHFKAIAQLLSEDPDLAGIRISAGNTLNCDQALSWYNAVKPYVTEGNTHQLAGSFDNYAGFWTQVRKDGNHATADELHNVGEAFIGAHYGMQTGIWWGWDGAARGEYCRASRDGKEIGYGENRSAWAAATVYKRQNGQIDAFLGTSERQATPSSFEFLSTDRPIYMDGKGPYYNYVVDMPGGTGYQRGQLNAELKIGVQYGEDVPMDPIEVGKSYVIMNANSKKAIGTYKDKNEEGAVIAQRLGGSYKTPYLWTVEALPKGSGGDQGYFLLRWNNNTSYLMDVKDWNTSAKGTLIVVAGGKGTNEQWFVEYAGNNFWYIRSRHSGLYLEVQNNSTQADSYVIQNTFTGKNNQKWRFLPASEAAPLETKAPAAPTELQAQVHTASIELSWTAPADADVASYVVLKDGDVIARHISETHFVDTDVRPDMEHHYVVKAMDKSRNLSVASEEVVATLANTPALLLHYTFENDVEDKTGFGFHPLTPGSELTYTILHKEGANSLYLKGNKSHYLMLPPMAGYYDQMTLSMYVNLRASQTWARIFDFGNDTDHYMFLTPNNGSNASLVFKNGGDEQKLNMNKIGQSAWHHVAVVLSADSVTLFIDGKWATSTDINIRPTDFLPKHNYLGASQFAADPFLNAYLDDVRMYNCALTIDQLNELRQGGEPVGLTEVECGIEQKSQPLYNLQGQTLSPKGQTRGFKVQQGRIVFEK